MSDVEGLVKLMEHAAESLKAAVDRTYPCGHCGSEQMLAHQATVAGSYARAVLQVVAASVSTEPVAAPDDPPPVSGLAGEPRKCPMCKRVIGLNRSGTGLAAHNISKAYRARKCAGSGLTGEPVDG